MPKPSKKSRWLRLIRRRDDLVVVEVVGQRYTYLGVTHGTFQEFQGMLRFNQGRALAYLKRTAGGCEKGDGTGPSRSDEQPVSDFDLHAQIRQMWKRERARRRRAP